ncbi:cilia- and flagella-associated protein 90 [Colius striatus]|uniref:cilia- and flagella-associated protein 90 n=1 Tax=Colius striatus TaxID=57412 RepID=UPI002B1E7B58|nr:cilia- and flagella-associated protein 90 [Colius striatus]
MAAPAAGSVIPGSPAPGGSRRAEQAVVSAAGRRKSPPLSTLSAFSFIPARREGPPELSYFHREAKTGDLSTYDAIFKRPESYSKNLHRCNRQHANSCGLNVNEEEMATPIAVLSSSEYGRRINKPIEQPIQDHARINHVQAEFYRKNGITCLLEQPSPSLYPC